MRRKAYDPVLTVERCLRLSTMDLNHAGVLRSRRGAKWSIEWNTISRQQAGRAALTVVDTSGDFASEIEIACYIHVENSPSAVLLRQRIHLPTTRSGIGDTRRWLRCDSELRGVCGRRCRELYLPPGTDEFACQRCHSLIHESQRHVKHPPPRGLQRVVRMRRMLEADVPTTWRLDQRIPMTDAQSYTTWPGVIYYHDPDERKIQRDIRSQAELARANVRRRVKSAKPPETEVA